MRIMIWHERYEEAAGFLPTFLHPLDERDAVTQLHEAYAHGGGWNDFKGFTLKFDPENVQEATIEYAGDPAYELIAWTKLREETVLLFQHGWVAVVQPDGSHRIARMD